MATTYLEITNEIMREMNEVPLTNLNFNDAIGVQQHIKDSVNRAYMDICNEEAQWPFLLVADSGDTDPFYGNSSKNTVAGTRFYDLKSVDSAQRDQFHTVDWDTFYLTTIGVDGESAPYTSRNLRFATTEDWKDFKRESENADDANNATGGTPTHVIRSPDGTKFGLSPIPDKVYKVYYTAWGQPAKLVNHDDKVVFPDSYVPVLIARTRYYCWQFKENPQAAAFALDDYKKGLDFMRSNLIEPTPSYFKDDRVRFI